MIIKVFSATMARDRESLGDVASEWLRQQPPDFEVAEIRTLQSSDSEYHCLSIIVFGRTKPPPKPYEKPPPTSVPGPGEPILKRSR